MKFTVEVDIDWIDEEGSIDEEIQRQLISGAAKIIEKKFTDVAASNIAKAADKLITAKTEQLIYSVLEKPVTISTGWNSKEEYDSIYDMVEQRMTNLYDKKIGSSGKCEKDPLLANIEKYVDNHVSSKLDNITRIIERHASNQVKDAINKNKLIDSLRTFLPESRKEEINKVINK